MKGHRIGYIRVSTFKQNTARQLEGIDVDKVFTDKASGKDTKRPELDALMEFVREGDIVIVHSMDRLARNLDDLRQIVRTLTGRGINIQFVKESLTFTGADSPTFAEPGLCHHHPTGTSSADSSAFPEF
jgi:DNA invertase Pin-like site-specific DNA recombinase